MKSKTLKRVQVTDIKPGDVIWFGLVDGITSEGEPTDGALRLCTHNTSKLTYRLGKRYIVCSIGVFNPIFGWTQYMYYDSEHLWVLT